MAFTSLSFLGLVAVAVLLYGLAPARARWLILLGVSLSFYCLGGGWTVLYVLYTAGTVYTAALLLGRFNAAQKAAGRSEAGPWKRRRRLVVLTACLLNFGLLYLLKYWNFTVALVPGAKLPLLGLVQPLGVSFFMFQSIGYVVDVYRGKIAPERNPLKLLLFVSFFPQMVQGPISRYDQLSGQLTAGKPLNADQLKYGIQLAMWGYFKKLVIADRAAVLVNTVLGDPWSYGGAVQAVGILFYCIQLYGDFSGGIDITRGVAQLFGIDMAENFRRPLFADSLTEFWRRWHITLGAWMRDYLFYPLSLSKPFARLGRFTRRRIGGKLGKILPTSLATFMIYFVIGIWHGASWKYIAYGFWNGILITLGMLLVPQFEWIKNRLHIRDEARWYRAFRVLRTNVLVFFGRYLTRAPRLLTAFWMMSQLLLHPVLSELGDGTLLSLGLGGFDLAVIGLGLALVIAVEWYQERGGHARAALERKAPVLQWLVILASLLGLLCLGILRADHISSDFIYKQF